MRYETRPRPELTTSLVFDSDPTFGQLYRAMRAAKREREAILQREPQIDPVLFREVRDLGLLMEFIRIAFLQAGGDRAPE